MFEKVVSSKMLNVGCWISMGKLSMLDEHLDNHGLFDGLALQRRSGDQTKRNGRKGRRRDATRNRVCSKYEDKKENNIQDISDQLVIKGTAKP